MKLLIAWTCAAVMTPLLPAQQWRWRAGYSYLWSPAWDQAMDYYYMARPFLDGRKAFLQSGLDVGLGIVFEGKMAPYHGLELDYANSLARYRDEAVEQRFRFHLLGLGYRLHLRRASRYDGFYGELGMSGVGAFLLKNYSASVETLSHGQRAWGGGARLSAEVGWRLSLFQGRVFPGFYARACGTLLYMPRSEPVLMQTQGVLLQKVQALLLFQGGITLSLR
jgi:hypothetical protein